MNERGERIAKMIVNMGLVKEAHAKEALALCEKNGRSFGQNIVGLGHVSDSSLMQLIVAQGAASPWSFEDGIPDQRYLRLISPSVMREHFLVPVQRIGDLLIVAMKDSHDHQALERVRTLTGLRVECVEANLDEIKNIIETVINGGKKPEPKPVVAEAPVQQPEAPRATIESEVVSADDTAPVAGLVDQIIADSVRRDATEILIESSKSGLSIRYRIDGKLRSIGDVPKSVSELVLARFRILSNVDMHAKDHALAGKMRIKSGGKELSFEANFTPTSLGQRLLLRKSNAAIEGRRLEDIGVARNELDLVRRAMADGEGLIVVAAQSSLLRTKALYSVLTDVVSPTREIVTVEESCGMPVTGVSHTVAPTGSPRSKAQHIEHVLRGSSEVVLVDGLEEESVAELVARAALAGRLVIAGIEAKSALQAIERLQELGVEKRFVAASLRGVLSVRQIRTLCKSCKKQVDGLYVSVGCPDCESTGYKGTIDVFEFLPVSEEVSRLIADGAHSSEIEACATKAGLRSLAEYATKRVERGETDVKEVEQSLNCILADLTPSVQQIINNEAARINDKIVLRPEREFGDSYEKEVEKEREDLQSHFTKQPYELG